MLVNHQDGRFVERGCEEGRRRVRPVVVDDDAREIGGKLCFSFARDIAGDVRDRGLSEREDRSHGLGGQPAVDDADTTCPRETFFLAGRDEAAVDDERRARVAPRAADSHDDGHVR